MGSVVVQTRGLIQPRINLGIVLASTFSLTLFIIALSTMSVNALGGVGGKPANPDPANPRSSSIFIYTLKPGAQKQDQVLLTNSSAKSQTIQLYAVDATTTNTGSLACKQQVETSTDVGGWVTVDEPEVTLNPNQEKTVGFSIQVPDSASPGEHGGCLVFQQKSDEGEVQGNIRIRTRQAVRIAITVPGEIHKVLSIEQFQVTTPNRQPLYAVTIKNTGNVSADTNVQLTAKNIFGHTVYKNGGAYPVFGGNKLALQFQDKQQPFWGGFFTAQAIVQYDKRPGVFSLKDSAQLVTLTSNTVRYFVAPSPIALLLICAPLVTIALYVGWHAKRTRVIRHQQKHWRQYVVQNDDTLETIAKAHGITWKKLATVNKLSPPYQLHAEQSIKVPSVSYKKEQKPKGKV
jgi:hypothetical protein